MVNRFVIALAAAVAIMALLVALPRLVGPNNQFRLEYDRTGNASTPDAPSESLIVNGDGRATLTKGSSTQSIELSSDKFAEVKSLVLDTGFMNLKSPSSQSSVSGEKHVIRVETDSGTQVVTWNSFNDTQAGGAPPIVLQLQQTLDGIIAGGQSASP